MRLTKAQIRFLKKVNETGSIAGKGSGILSRNLSAKGMIEPDKARGNWVPYKLTEAGREALSSNS